MYIIPQQQAVYAAMKHIFEVHQKSEARIRPHFHLTGPSGSGKTYLLGLLCEELKMPFVELNAAGLTAEGLSGNSLSKALRKLRDNWQEPNVIFVDEFDKLFQRNGETTEGFRSAVQDEFLTALESKYTSVFGEYGKYDQIVVSNSLFIFAGAYSNQEITSIQGLKDAGLRTEFVGRVPLVLATQEIPTDELKRMIKETALFKDYLGLFPQAKAATAAKAIGAMIEEQNRELKIGVRLLNSCTHQYFMQG